MSNQDPTVETLLETIERQSIAIDALERRLAALENADRVVMEADSVSAAVVSPQDSSVATEVEDKRPISRRSILRLAGASAVGAIGAVVADATPAAAANGGSVLIADATNTGTAMTVLTNTGGVNNTAVGGFKAVGASGSNGVIGQSSGNLGAGVFGASDSGYGIYGESSSGYGLFAGGNGRVGLSAHTTLGAPTAGTYTTGDIIRDGSGNFYACVAGGSPGTWVRIAAQPPSTGSAAGRMVFLPQSDRYVDTRDGRGGFTGRLSNSAQDFTLWGVPGRDGLTIPSTAIAVLGNVTAVSPATAGLLKVLPGGAVTTTGTSTVNFNSGVNTANAFSCRLDSSGRIRVAAFVSGVDVLLDVVAYFEA